VAWRSKRPIKSAKGPQKEEEGRNPYGHNGGNYVSTLFEKKIEEFAGSGQRVPQTPDQRGGRLKKMRNMTRANGENADFQLGVGGSSVRVKAHSRGVHPD